MKEIILTLIIGIAAGLADIAPMVKMKLDKHSIASAFILYLTVPFLILNTDLFGMAWWLKGSVITLFIALPVIIIVSKTEKKSVPPMVVSSIVLGTLIGIAGHLLKI
jgi:hypothetical protein